MSSFVSCPETFLFSDFCFKFQSVDTLPFLEEANFKVDGLGGYQEWYEMCIWYDISMLFVPYENISKIITND